MKFKRIPFILIGFFLWGGLRSAELSESERAFVLEKVLHEVSEKYPKKIIWDEASSLKILDTFWKMLPGSSVIFTSEEQNKATIKIKSTFTEKKNASETPLFTLRQAGVLCDMYDSRYNLLVAQQKAPARTPISKKCFDLYINALLQSLDRFSGYMNPETVELQKRQKEDWVGLGLVVSRNPQTWQIEVEKLVPKGPAEASHRIQVGDLLLGASQKEKEYESFEALSLNEVSQKLLGQEGSQVKLRVFRPSSAGQPEKIFEIELVRRKVAPSPLRIQAISLSDGDFGGFAWIRIPEFYVREPDGEGLTRDLIRLLNELSKVLPQGILLDLRGNPGGNEEELMNVLGLFVGSQSIGTENFRDRKRELKTNGEAAFRGPLAVLVDGASGSAAEVFAMGMKSLKRAPVFGKHTFGKGSLQELISIQMPPEQKTSRASSEKNLGLLRLTVGTIEGIDHKPLHEVGVEPDYVLPADVANMSLLQTRMKTLKIKYWLSSKEGVVSGDWKDCPDPENWPLILETSSSSSVDRVFLEGLVLLGKMVEEFTHEQSPPPPAK